MDNDALDDLDDKQEETILGFSPEFDVSNCPSSFYRDVQLTCSVSHYKGSISSNGNELNPWQLGVFRLA